MLEEITRKYNLQSQQYKFSSVMRLSLSLTEEVSLPVSLLPLLTTPYYGLQFPVTGFLDQLNPYCLHGS